MRWSCAVVAYLVVTGVAAVVHAEPQGNAALTIGGAGVGYDGEFWDHAEFHLGLRGDVMFARERGYDFGIGPYAELGTFAFDELQFGGGVTTLLPIHDTLPLVASFGAYGRVGDDDQVPGGRGGGLEPGIAGALFWGSRSFNFHANYVLAGGLLVGYRHSLGESRETELMIAAQLDLVILALPFIALADWLRGPSSEAEPIDPPALEDDGAVAPAALLRF
jgi:hypothetical protein